MLQQRISKLYIFGIAIAALTFGIITHTYALTVSPARLEINGDPGATVGGEFTLINEQATTETFYASYENFGAEGETGAPSFSSEKNGLDTWMSVAPEQVTIKPGQIIKVPYSIAIPKGTDPGGYFAAIFWSTTPPSTATTQLSIGAKIGLLVLLRVNGDIKEQAGITQFDRNGHGFFYTTLPVDFRYKFRNEGGDRVEPTGQITINDTVFIPADHLDANSAQGNILPNSVRQFSVEWLKQAAPQPVQGFLNEAGYEWHNFALGLYSAHLNLAYGTKGLHTKKTVWFFVFPWQLVILLLVGITIIWWIGRGLLRRYNRYIIRQSQLSPSQRDDNHS